MNHLLRKRPIVFSLLIGILIVFHTGTLSFAAMIPSTVFTQVNNDGFSFSLPRLVALGDAQLGVIWADGREIDAATLDDVFFTFSVDGGATWSEDLKVADGGFSGVDGITTDGQGNVVASSGSSTFTALDGDYSNWTTFVWSAVPSGQTDFVELNANSDVSIDPSSGRVALFGSVDLGGISDRAQMITYAADDFFIGDDYAFGSITNDFDGWPSGLSFWPKLSVDANNGHFWYVWEDARHPHPERSSLYALYSGDGLNTLSTEIAVPIPRRGNGSLINAANPHVLVRADGKIFITYTDAINSAVAENVYLVESISVNPVTFTEPRLLIQCELDGQDRWDGAITQDGNPQYAVQIEAGGLDSEVRALTSNDGGKTFDNDLWVSGDFGRLGSMAIFRDGGEEKLALAIDGLELFVTSAKLDFSPPTPPTGLRALVGDRVIHLQWEPSSDDNEVARYWVERRPAGSEDSFETIAPVLGTRFTDAEKSGAFEYRVVSEDLAGNRNVSQQVVTASAMAGDGLPTQGQVIYSNQTGIHRINLDGSSGALLIADAIFPSVFQNGKGFIFAREGAVFQSRLDGTNVQPISIENSPIDFLNAGGSPFPIGYTWVNSCLGNFFGEGQLMLDSVTTFDAGVGFELIIEFAVSPSDTMVAACSLGQSGCNTARDYRGTRLLLSNVATGQFAYFGAGVGGIEDDIEFIDFNPDGTEVILTRKDDEVTNVWRYSVHVDPPAIQDGVRLSDSPVGAEIEDPRFDVSGEWVTYRRNDQLMLVNRDGSQTRALGFDGQNATLIEEVQTEVLDWRLR